MKQTRKRIIPSDETRRKMSLAKIGNKIMLGRKLSQEWKKKISDSLKGNKNTKGHKLSEEHRRKCSNALKGENHPNWKGGISSLNETIRKSLDYKLWREAVFKRDKFTCIWCGQIGGELQADHIKPFCNYPELRFAIDNGRTLCKQCHSKTETYCSKAKHF